MPGGDAPDDGVADGFEVEPGFRPPLDLLSHHQALLPLHLHRKGGAAGRREGGVAPLHRRLDVLRIEVAAAQDDEVLEACDHEELATGEHPEVAGAQERSGAGIAQERRERRSGLHRPPPVAVRHAGAGDPYLPYPARRAGGQRLGIGDDDLLPEPGPAVTDQGARSAVAGWRRLSAFESGGVELAHTR